MIIPAIADFFRYKVVGSIFILASWSPIDEVKMVKQFSKEGLSVTFACDPKILEKITDYNFQGILYVEQDLNLLEKVKRKYFSHWYKWLIISEAIPDTLHKIRYDSDVTMLREDNGTIFPENTTTLGGLNGTFSTSELANTTIFFDEIYVHPSGGASQHEWAHWSTPGLQVTGDWQRILRRKDLQEYPFRISAPVAHFTEGNYKGSFAEYLVDMTVADAGLRCSYSAASLLVDAVNARPTLVPVHYWNVAEMKNSTQGLLKSEGAEIGAGPLRIMHKRMAFVDSVMPIWILRVGFTYLADRQSSSNMYVEPFTQSVWWSCLVIGVTLAIAQRIASMKPEEKEGAYMTVLATWLQQDANAVPEGITGRWTFTVLSICSMLVHAYYTSAIVSALMSTGRGGPKTLRALADSRYAIASEDHDFIRKTMFNVETNWDDLEYLKKRKMTSKFYQDIKVGVQLIQQGYTAYHAEYHQIYRYLNELSDDDICKLQHVDTIPESMTYLSTTARGQWTNTLRASGAWLYETGLARRTISQIQLHPPPCRAAMLAERVTFWDVASLLALTTLGAIASLGLLGLEIILARIKKPKVEVEFNEESLVYIE